MDLGYAYRNCFRTWWICAYREKRTNERLFIAMSVFGFLYHLLIFVIGVLVSILLALVLIYIFTSNASKDQSDPLLFLSEPEKSTILTLPIDSPSAQGIWMFGSLVTQRRSASQVHVQAVYVKLADQYLLLHLISKRMKHLHQKTPIAFSQVHIFDLKQGKIALKPVEQHRTKYWWKKTPLVLSQLRHLACYQILRNKQRKKKDPSDDGQTTFSEYLRPMTLPWVTKKVKEATEYGLLEICFPTEICTSWSVLPRQCHQTITDIVRLWIPQSICGIFSLKIGWNPSICIHQPFEGRMVLSLDERHKVNRQYWSEFLEIDRNWIPSNYLSVEDHRSKEGMHSFCLADVDSIVSRSSLSNRSIQERLSHRDQSDDLSLYEKFRGELSTAELFSKKNPTETKAPETTIVYAVDSSVEHAFR